MKRLIKFRGLRTDGKGWVYGSLVNNGFCDSKTNQEVPYIFNPEECDNADCWQDFDDDYGYYEVIPESVGQLTGFKDKNGVDIYEGDILSIKEFENNVMSIKDLSSEESEEMFEGLSLDQIRGDFRKEYISDVKWEEDCFIIKSGHEHYDMLLGCLFGDMRRSLPIFDFEIIGNIHENKNNS